MTAGGAAFVTPHAVRQFQQRICPLPYELALEAILHGLARHAKPPKPSHNGMSVYVRVRGKFNFRAVIRQNPDRTLPTVITILRSGK